MPKMLSTLCSAIMPARSAIGAPGFVGAGEGASIHPGGGGDSGSGNAVRQGTGSGGIFAGEICEELVVREGLVQVDLTEAERALLIQAISLVRLGAEFSADEQLALKRLAERLGQYQQQPGSVPNGDIKPWS